MCESTSSKTCGGGYDFATVIDRRGQGASKWNLMQTWNEDAHVRGITPLSVADMEFKMAPQIIEGRKNTSTSRHWATASVTISSTAPS